MKSVFLFTIFFLTYGCASKHHVTDYNKAAYEVSEKIAYIEKQYHRSLKGKPYTYYGIEDIINLTCIVPCALDCGWSGCNFDVTQNEIQLWKNWLEENHANISYDLNNEYSRLIDSLGGGKMKVIMVTFNDKEVRNSKGLEGIMFVKRWRERKK